MTKNFTIDKIIIKPGERKRVNIDMGRIYDFTDVKMSAEVIRGKKDGPTLFISSAIHGDEIGGIEILRRLLQSNALKNICGTLIVIPIVNTFGFNDRTRYLPDRRDLNRCFPGLSNGSLSSQVAHKFMKEIVKKSDYGIDLHTGAYHRCNHPQVRADISNSTTLNLAKAFGAPIIINSDLKDGSLRSAVIQEKIPMLLYEAGEALRFDEESIKIGTTGILNFMREIGMINSKFCELSPKKIFIAHSSSWIRAPKSGIHIPRAKLGELVKKHKILGEISDPFGDNKTYVRAAEDGIVIGMSKLPLANKGDALFHLASDSVNGKQKNKIFHNDNLENIDPIFIK
jgi:predicted deacylase